ncbi:MAG: AraC-like ligand-binding domain-containing protein [Gammaproteobacteria bacterium]
MSQVLKLSTNDQPLRQRQEWLREVIGREYTQVEITPPGDGSLFNEMTIYPWQNLRLSVIRSSAIALQRPPREPHAVSQDAFFAVVLLAGDYALEQHGRNVYLQPGDMTLYDATLPHRIRCPQNFSKLIVSIPRPLLRDRIAGAERCTALHIPGNRGIGCVAANFIRSAASQTGSLAAQEFVALAEHALDLLVMALASVRPVACNLSGSRTAALHRVKDFIAKHLAEPDLDTATVAGGVGLSSRYINRLFEDEAVSLMRYVWQRRLENCRTDLFDPAQAGRPLSEIAFRWGFNDAAHFSRAFKQRFGCSPRDYRQAAGGKSVAGIKKNNPPQRNGG